MKRKQILLLVVISLLLLAVPVVYAQTATLTYDVFCVVGGNCANNRGLSVWGDPNTCAPSRVAYIQWENITGTNSIGTASLTLTFSAGTDFGGNYTFELREVTNDTWVESQGSDIGYTSTVLASQTVTPASDFDTVTFTSAALAAYFETARTTDGEASLAVVMTGGCTTGRTKAEFYDRESGGAAPLLSLAPTAVSLTGFSASSDGPNPAIWIGAFVGVALLGFLVYGYSTKRAARGES